MENKKPNIQQVVRERATRAIDEYLKGLDDRIKTMMTQSLCSLLGLSYSSYGRTEIDHCNGRNSILEEVIKTKAKDEVERLMKGFSFADMDKSLVLDAFRKEFKNHMDYAIKRQAEAKANEYVKVTVDRLTMNELKKYGFEEIPEKK